MKHKRLIVNAACALLLVGCSLTAYAFADTTSPDDTTGPGVSSTQTMPKHQTTVEGSDTSAGKPTGLKTNVQRSSNINVQGKSTEAGQGGLKLNSNNLTMCQHRQSEINAIQNRIVSRSTNQITLFNTITQRVEMFVTSNKLTIPDYVNLTGSVATDQTLVGTDLTSLKANQTLDCSSSDPIGTLTDFKANVQNMFTDMQTYKTDLLKLVTAVKGVADPNHTKGNTHKPSGQGSQTANIQSGVNEE